MRPRCGQEGVADRVGDPLAMRGRQIDIALAHRCVALARLRHRLQEGLAERKDSLSSAADQTGAISKNARKRVDEQYPMVRAYDQDGHGQRRGHLCRGNVLGIGCYTLPIK